MKQAQITDTRVLRFLEQHRDFAASLNGGSRQPVHEKRLRALEQFAGMGFPTLRDEEWRYTNVKHVTEVPYLFPRTEVSLHESDVTRTLIGYAGGPLLVFINGRFREELSRLADLPEGLVAEDLRSVLDTGGENSASIDNLRGEYESAFAALNTAFLRHGAYIRVRKNTVIEQPVHCLFVTQSDTEPIQAHPRLLVVVEEGAQLQLVEQYSGSDANIYMTNSVVEVHVGENGSMEHVRLQLEGPQAFHVSTALSRLAGNSRYDNHFFSFGASVVRNDVRTVLDGEGAHVSLNGLYMPRGAQHMDSHTLIDHAQPHCTSEELYKGLLADESRGVFCGRIIVRQDAQKTDARQSNKNLLLSDHAMIDTKPQLEIYADDVRCTHGATIGRIDETALFYLRSRGISLAESRDILAYAFARDIVQKVRAESLRAWLDDFLQSQFAKSRKKG